MKRSVLILSFLLVVVSIIFGQRSQYYDALFLKSIIDDPGSQGKFTVQIQTSKVLQYYFPGLNDYDLDSALMANPFLNPYYITNDGTMSASVSGSKSPELLSSIASLDVTNFADGLAKFLVERSKEELNVAFFRKFKELFIDYPELTVIFPTTTKFLNEINSFQYAAMLPALKVAFQKDLNAFSTNLLNLRETSNYDGYNTNTNIKNRADSIIKLLNTPEGRSVLGAIMVSDGINKGNNAAEIINNLVSDKICTDYPDEIFTNLIKFVDLISQSLRSNEEGRVWITKQQANDLIKDDITFRIYLGLIYASDQNDNYNIKFSLVGSTLFLKDFLIDLNSKWQSGEAQEFKNSFSSMVTAMSVIADNAQSIINSKQQGQQPSILVYADYASSIARFLKLSVNFFPVNNSINPSLKGISNELLKFTNVIDDATNACYDLKSQNYGALVLHTSMMLSEILGDSYNDSFKRNFIKYGIFMANVVEANNSDEVNEAIEAAVLPVGSSSIKRETDFNISLNAFIGPYGGIEYLPKLKIDPWAFTFGLTAPVGVAVSWGNLGKHESCDVKNKKGGKSITLFMPLIDVGSMASFRMGNDSSEVASEVKLSNIISPGLYLYYGFGKCPISIGLGAQLGPQLRGVTAKDINLDKNLYFRFGFNIVVDIPFFNLYTRN